MNLWIWPKMLSTIQTLPLWYSTWRGLFKGRSECSLNVRWARFKLSAKYLNLQINRFKSITMMAKKRSVTKAQIFHKYRSCNSYQRQTRDPRLKTLVLAKTHFEPSPDNKIHHHTSSTLSRPQPQSDVTEQKSLEDQRKTRWNNNRKHKKFNLFSSVGVKYIQIIQNAAIGCQHMATGSIRCIEIGKMNPFFFFFSGVFVFQKEGARNVWINSAILDQFLDQQII